MSGVALPSPAPALRHLRAPRSRLSRPLGVADSRPTRSALISILPLLPRSKRKLFWLSTPGCHERGPFPSLTSVKPGTRASLAATSAGLQGSKAGGGPTPGRRTTSPRRGAPARIPSGAAQDPDSAGRTKVRRLGSAPSRARDSRGQRQPRDRAEGEDRLGLPKPDGDALPAPTQPCQLPKGKWRGGGRAEAASVAQRPWGAAVKDSPLEGPRSSRGYILGLALSRSLLPKGEAVPLRGSWLLPTLVR